jgi:hypothetical protein
VTRALTLTQPWATLVATRQKLVETRSWGTSYRGPILIHAAKGYPPLARDLTIDLQVRGILQVPKGHTPWAHHPIPLGEFVARAVLDDVRSTEWSRQHLDALELELGDYSAGRFAWWLRDIEPIDPPVAWRGALGLWDGPDLTSGART